MNKRIDFTKYRQEWLESHREPFSGPIPPYWAVITPIHRVTVPVPFCGFVRVFISRGANKKERDVKVSKRSLFLLRDLFLRSGGEKWSVEKKTDSVIFSRGGEIVLRVRGSRSGWL